MCSSFTLPHPLVQVPHESLVAKHRSRVSVRNEKLLPDPFPGSGRKVPPPQRTPNDWTVMIETLPDAMILLASTHAPSGGNGGVAVHSTDSLFLAAEGPSTTGLGSWIKDNVFTLLILGAACVAGVGAIRQNTSKVLTVAVLIMIVLAIVGVAGSAATQQTLMQWTLGMFGL